MAPDVRVKPVRFDNHGHRIPTHVAFDASLDLAVARIGRFFFRGDRIDVWSIDGVGNL